MTLAIILIVVAAIALAVIFRISFPRALRLSSDASVPNQIQPLDVEAFRNLIDPAEREYLRRKLPAPEFRVVQRKRLRAMAAYVQIAGQNAAVLIEIAQAALSASNPEAVEAARQLIDSALLLRRNVAFALLRIYLAMAWPDSNSAAAPVLNGYVQLNGAAMLLGRLRNPASPLRISAS
jgi:hypothetical protein